MRLISRATSVALTGIRAGVAAVGFAPEERRAVEIYVLVTVCNLPGAVAAEAAGCSKQNVSKLLRAVEERRDRADYGRRLSLLETTLMGEA